MERLYELIGAGIPQNVLLSVRISEKLSGLIKQEADRQGIRRSHLVKLLLAKAISSQHAKRDSHDIGVIQRNASSKSRIV